MSTLFGTDPNQVPTNADLGSLAFTDGKGAGNISAGTVDFIKANKVTNVSSIRPSLDLNFLTKKLDSRITFTRASAATYVGADGYIKYAAADEPRFDHDPVTKEYKGFLIEEQRTNFLTNTNVFAGTAWGNGSTTIVNTTSATLSPDGTTNAYKLVEANQSSRHYLFCTVNTSAYNASKFTSSVYLKAAERRYASLSYGTSNYQLMTVDLQTGTIIGTADDSGDASVLESYSITDAGNGWWRCTVTVTDNIASANRGVLTVSLATTATVPTSGYGDIYSGDGASGIYMWGPQCELGAFATTYIPNTTTASLIRNFDLVYMSDLSWYSQTASTFLFDATIPNTSKTTYIYYLTNLQAFGGTERVQLAINASNNLTCALVASNVITLAGTTHSFVSPTYKCAFAFDYNSATSIRSTTSIDTPTINATPPKPTYMYIGVAVNTGALNGWLKRFKYYPKRLSDAELKELTK